MKKVYLLMVMVMLSITCFSQTTIAVQDFDAGTSLAFTNTNGATQTGSSVSGDRPASSNFYSNASTAWKANNETSTLTFSNVTGLSAYSSKYFEFQLAAWSIGSSGNGVDGTDVVTVSISLDGGGTYSDEITVNGNNNAYWHYSTGTGLASTNYDGNNTPVNFAPGGGGNRTTDGYSTVRVSLDNSVSQARLKIKLLNNASAEYWTINEVKIIGTLIPVGSSTLSTGPTSEPLSISSLTNTQGAASTNFDFIVQDDGATPATDALPTQISQIVFTSGTGNAVTDWSAVISGAELSDGTNSTSSATIGTSSITFTGLPTSIGDLGYIADDASKTYNLKIWLKTSLGSFATNIDGKDFVFRVQGNGITVTGSEFASGQDVNSGDGNNTVSVIATALAFVQNTTTPTGVNVAMSPAPTVSANDANGNRDLDFVANVDVTSSGTLSTSPVTVAPIAGLASFNANIIHTASSTGLQLTAASTGLSSATSNLFDITTASSASDYFRSKANGNWGSFSSWESSPDNNTWIDATLIPDENANTITIRNDHTITVAAAATADQVVVESGGSLVLNANFTLADGAGTDLDVNGTLINTSGSHTITGTISQNGGSLYQHNRNGSAVLNATWSATSTAEIIGSISSSPTNLGQSFGNFTWNCTSQSGNVGLGNPSGFNITGNLTITSTGGATNRAVRFTAGTSYSLNIGGDLILNGGHLGLSSGSGDMTLTVSGNVSVSNSSELYLSQGGSGSNTLQIAGNLSVNSGTITETGSSANCKIEFNKSGSQSISLAAATISNDLNYVIASASATTLLSNIPVNTGRTLTINGTLNASTNQITGAGGVAANGTLISSHLNGIGSTGTLANTGTNTFGSTSTITYDAAGAQTFEGRTDYANVVINGGGDKSLNGNAVLSGTLTITNGNVVLGANNLTVENTSGGNTTSYIKTDGTGIFTVNNITTAKTLPVGNAKYNPLIIENGNGHNWSVKVIDGLTADPGFNTDKAVLLQWDITPSINPPSSGADITFQFDQSTQGGVSFNINNDIQAWHNPNNGGWMRSRFPSTPSIVNASTATVKISGITEFSRYALSNVDGPLPVNFLSFSGYKSGSVNKLQWTTASEQNCLGFEVQRSTDGINFSSIGFVNTLAIGGNSTDRLSYNFNDNNVAGEKQYYRIRQVDIDNHGRLSNVILLKGSKPLIVSIDGIYPNPANNEINVLLAAPARDKATLIVTDISGRVLLQQLVNVETGINSIPVNISRFASGTYLIKLAGQTSVESAGAKFIKQ
ncbi:MAG: T9SS type A sorting domain-containing protein [Chitinophagaceae bacterium]